MPSRLSITRRDFLNGIAAGAGAAAFASPLDIYAALGSDYYPPARTGLRGSHAGSFEVAHAVAWAGHRYDKPTELTDDVYDFVIVGGGISGLSAAAFYRNYTGADSKILILDNHDDFGGHAKRNEFEVDGRTLIGYGGSQSIDSPSQYSMVSKQLLADLGIDTQRFYEYFDQEFFSERSLRRAAYFSADAYGKDVSAPFVLRGWSGSGLQRPEEIIARYPVAEASKAALIRLLDDDRDYRPDLSRSEKIDFLRSISYTQYLENYASVPGEVTEIIRDMILGLWGVGWDAISALQACRSRMPATQGLGVSEPENSGGSRDEPYIFHFPDGNAGIARALVRRLLPDAIPGTTMESLVTARADYSELDRNGAATRIRLNSTVVDIGHTTDGGHVDVTYVTSGNVYRVRGRHVVFAGYNAMLPHICREMPEQQREAIGYAEKVPLVYMSIAVRNWKAFAEMGYSSFYIPRSKYMYSFGLDFPVSMGGYQYATSPDEPTIIHGAWVPSVPDQGLSARQQHAAGRRKLYEVTFEEIEEDIIEKMSGALGPGGFDAERDIAAITVNRWPHGYAYEYNDLSDPLGFSPENGPHVAGRAQIGRISIANSDASAYAYVDGAIDAAHRAVKEQLLIA